MADYNSAYTGAQIDSAIALANTAVQQATGKGLSTEDYTTAEKNKLSGIESGATAVSDNTVAGWGYIKILTFTSKTIATNAWTSDSTYTGYTKKATISNLTGVTGSMFAQVVFSPSDAASGNLAAVCSTGTNSVTVYAKETPSSSVSVLSIAVWG